MDELYIKKVLNGDIDAFKYFVRQYKDMAFTVAVAVLKNEFDAKDVVQEAFLMAFKRLKSFKRKSKFSTWFYRIVINESFKQVKKREQEHYEIQNIPSESIKDIPQTIVSLKEEEQKYYIDLALKRIPSKEGLALILFYLEEYSVAEISDITGWSASNIKVILFRARKNIYRELWQLLKSEIQSLY
ncbi:MAG: RNA polymerase sigma factor [Bacteroidales bacterium]|nr:RNA polymerase sigma factor [Bacteroidales bacterium]